MNINKTHCGPLFEVERSAEASAEADYWGENVMQLMPHRDLVVAGHQGEEPDHRENDF